MPYSIDKDQIILFLKEEIGLAIKKDPETIDKNVNFLRFGISSIQTIMILNKIKKKLAIEVNPFAMFEFKTIAELSEYLYKCTAISYEH